MPTVSLIGPGALQTAGQRIQKLGFKKALIVTDAGMSKSGAVKDVTSVLDSIGVGHVMFDKAIPNPTDVNVSACDFAQHSAGVAHQIAELLFCFSRHAAHLLDNLPCGCFPPKHTQRIFALAAMNRSV